MPEDTAEELISCRELFDTAEAKLAFDRQINILFETKGGEYVAEYLAALKNIMPRRTHTSPQSQKTQ